ncbi:TIGR03364 family FAD-dependent oxidoreductase [soil metagenome]
MQNKQFDIAIVGAGIVGLAHALAAVKRGLKVVVFERDTRAVGASIRNFGFVTVTGQEAGDVWRRACLSRDIWEQVAPEAGIAIVHRGLWLTAQRPEAAAVLEAFMKTDMAERCTLLGRQQAAARAPMLKLAHASVALVSEEDLRVESREAIPKLAAWLAHKHGVEFHFGEAVLDIQAPHLRTSRGEYQAERIVVCSNTELGGLFSERIAAYGLTLCKLQMLRVRPPMNFRLPGSVMSDLSLVRYHGYSKLPEAKALLERLQAEEGEALRNGVHLIVVQSEDGTLVVGDSHHYHATPDPFASDGVDELILRHLHETVALDQAEVTERWVGIYPSSPNSAHVVDAPDAATRIVIVTSGTGASTGFGLAEDVMSNW